MPRCLLFFLILTLRLSGQDSLFQKITAKDRASDDNFGWSCAIYQNYAVVGAPQKQHQYNRNAGQAYIFERNNLGLWREKGKLKTRDFKQFDFFGNAVCISADYVVVGAFGDNEGKDEYSVLRMGAAYVYKYSAGKWTFFQKLEARQRQNEDCFGFDVSISGRLLAVSAPGQRLQSGDAAGVIHIYEPDSAGFWHETASIAAPNKSCFRFGSKICLYQNFLLTNDENSEAVYLYEFNNGQWQLRQTFSALIKTDQAFGNSLHIYRDQLVIGAEGDFDPFEGKTRPMTDSVMRMGIQDKNGMFKDILIPNDKRVKDSLGISQKYFHMVAKPLEPELSRKERMAGAGAAYIYKKNALGEWIYQQRIVSNDIDIDDHFGKAVVISDSLLVVGAFGDKLEDRSVKNNYYAGAVYVFRLKDGKWIQDKKIVSNNRSVWEKFGFSLGIFEKTIIIGSRFEQSDVSGKHPLNAAGACYILKER